MLPCVRFAIALSGVAAALGTFWLIILNVYDSKCPTYYGRECNDNGRCDVFGVCHCDPLFSGEACEHTGVPGYLAATNRVCNGLGKVIWPNMHMFPECVETLPVFTARSGGWNARQCMNRRAEATKKLYYYETADADDVAGLPTCACPPGFAGPDCRPACPLSLDEEICSGNGNKTVGRMRNGTAGDGCQCTTPLSLAKAMPYLNEYQKSQVAADPDAYADGLCARLARIDLGPAKSVEYIQPTASLPVLTGLNATRQYYAVIPTPTQNAYVCICDERHYGEKCETGVCPQTEDGVFCSGNGHKQLGFGYEFNTTRSVSAFGEPGTPLCSVGKDGCCVENQKLCSVPEIQCPATRPYRCSTTKQCVGVPRTSRCDQGWQYGYWDDPSKAPRRAVVAGDNTLRSRLVAYFFRIKNGTVSFTYRGREYVSPEGQEFWSGALNETLDNVIESAFSVEDSVEVEIRTDGPNLVEFWPAPFVHGETGYEPLVRLRSNYGLRSVVDIAGSKVAFGDLGSASLLLANLSADAYLRPGGSVVDASACFTDLSACAWPRDNTGPYSLCERNGKLGSVASTNACPVPTRPFQLVYTVAYGKPRVPTPISSDVRWTMDPFVGTSVSSTMRVQGTGIWVGQMVELDDLRVPCVCEPPVAPLQNATAWNTKWAMEGSRPRAAEGSGYALAKVEVAGDARWVRGVLLPGSQSVVDEYGDTHPNVVTSKVLSKEEYERGVPTPSDAVHPHRCPDGRGAKPMMWELRDVPTSTNCTMVSRARTECDNGCVCTLTRCTCPDDSPSETPLFELVSQKLASASKCWIIRPEVGNWTRVSTNATTTCWTSSSFDVPSEFRGSGISRIVARFFGGAWFDVEFEEGAGDRVHPLVDDVQKPFDEWCVEGNGTLSAEFMPVGISAYRAAPEYELVGSENQNLTQNVVWNDLTTWSTTDGGWLRVNFPQGPVHLVGLYVVFETMGLWVNDAIGGLSATLSVHAGTVQSRDEFRVDWEWLVDVVGNVVNGTDARFVPLDGTYQSLRIVSRFPMSIRRFVPLTDQMCTEGLLLPGDTYPEDVIKLRDRRLDPNATGICVSDDSCVLGGESAAGDGECADYKFLTWGLEPTETFVVSRNLSAEEVVLASQPVLVLTPDANISTACWGNCCAWGSVVPTGAFTCPEEGNYTLVFDGAHTTIAYTHAPPRYVARERRLVWGPNLVEGENTCRNGTDYTDCGASTRLDARDPGLSCEPTPLERAFMERNTSAREFQSSATIPELLDMGMRLNFTASWVRTIHKLGRGPCGDCDGRTRCVDGTCVDHAAQCPVARYVTPGDGCVRIDADRKSYKCACGVGWSGFECDKGPCTAMDYTTGRGDPHEWCTCGGPNERSFPKIKAKPPFVFKVKSEGYTRKDLLRMNRARARTSPNDVGLENVRYTEAPWGYAIKRQFTRGGTTFYSNCGFYVRVPDGRLMDMEDCVEERSRTYPFEVTKWRNFTFTYANGSTVWMQPKWNTIWGEFTYDDAPFRCGSTCVSDERECYRNNLVNPPCGGNGECRADGSCKCEAGRETFVLTEKLSLAVSIPYASKNGVSQPTEWTTPDNVWYSTAVCQARNCSVEDCSPPYGCFVGTLNLNFADRLVPCEDGTGRKGMCGADQAACRRGEVQAPVLCSGNGILRKRDYRDEWYCACGTPRSVLIQNTSEVRETTELIPNGFGGPRCDQYYCQDDASKIWLQRTDPRTNKPYVGSDGLPLPYKIRGPCDAPVGPRIEDMGLWRQCCDKKRLDQCEKIPCMKGRTDQKYMTCEYPHLCMDSTSQPLVYSCNGHGKALADGTCACDNTDTEGFTYDESIWSGKGCIRRVQCEIAETSGAMCNKKKDCADFESWSWIPYVPYFEQQWPTLLMLAGLPPTNQTFVDLVFRDNRKERLRYIGSQIGQDVLDEQANAQTSICVLSPDEDPANPLGMLPYDREDVGTYGQGYDSPFLVTDLAYDNQGALSSSVVQRVLTDGRFGEGSKYANEDYVRLSSTSASVKTDPGVRVTARFPRPIRVRAIRVHARKVGSANPTIRFSGKDDVPVCSSPPAVSSTEFRWVGPGFVWYCVPMYKPFNFKSYDYILQFKTNCEPQEGAEKCTQWKDSVCASLGYEINLPGAYRKTLPGCDEGASRCCQPLDVNTFDPTEELTIRLVLNTTQDQTLDLDEVQVYGSYDGAAQEVPSSLRYELDYKSAGIAPGCHDAKFMDSALQSQNLAEHVARNWTGWPLRSRLPPDPLTRMNATQAEEACLAMGSVFATNRGGEMANVEAEVLGSACFLDQQGSGQTPCWVNARDRNEVVHARPTDIMRTSCTVWGCWTPFNSTLDVFSTPATDVGGEQWKVKWPANNDSFVTLEDAIADLIEENRIQSEMQKKLRGADVATVVYAHPLDLVRTTQISEASAMLVVGSESSRAAARTHLYRPADYVPETPVKRDKDAVFASTTVPKHTMWTNPKVCTITVYSRPLCGVQSFEGRSQGNSYCEGRVNENAFSYSLFYAAKCKWNSDRSRGARKTFVVTPRDDYSILDRRDLFLGEKYDECVDGSTTCSDLGLNLRGWFDTPVSSFSMSGPCALEIIGVRPTNYPERNVMDGYDPVDFKQAGTYAYYLDGSQTRPAWMHYTADVSGGGVWPERCYSTFEKSPPWSGSVEFVDPQTGTTAGRDTRNIFTSTRSRFNAERLYDMGVVNVRVIAKFTTRKLEIDYGVQPWSSSPPNDNAYVLGYRSHPYMCSRVKVTELKRVFAGVRFPEHTRRVLYYDVARVKKQTTAHTFDRWSSYIAPSDPGWPTSVTSTKRVFVNNPISWLTHVPRETNPDEIPLTAEQLRTGMQQLIEKAYEMRMQFLPNTSSPGLGYDPLLYGIRSPEDVMTWRHSPTYWRAFMLGVRDYQVSPWDNPAGVDPMYVPSSKVYTFTSNEYDNTLLHYASYTSREISSTGEYGYKFPSGVITTGLVDEDIPLVMPYARCDGYEMPREVVRCNRCAAPKRADWEWNQGFTNPQRVNFVAGLTSMQQSSNVFVTWRSQKYSTLELYQPLSSYETTRPDAYARLSSAIRVEDIRRYAHDASAPLDIYSPGYYLDACVVVNRTSDVAFAFQPAVCERPEFRAMCLRDYKRYAIQTGLQCDECGLDSRSAPASPNLTVFDAYPKADPAKFPLEHAIKDAWLAGQLESYLNLNPLPADAVVAFLRSQGNVSFVHAFPGFYRAFWKGISTREGFLSRGQIKDTDTWIDLDFRRMFPHSCGVVYSKYTGEGGPMCAKSAEFCSRNVQFETKLMAPELVPQALAPVANSVSVYDEPQCGRLVRPWDLLRPTEDEPPPPADGKFILLEYDPREHVTIKTVASPAYVRNTYRDLDVIRPGSVVKVNITCASLPCRVSVWVGSLNPFFQDSDRRLTLGELNPARAREATVGYFNVTGEADYSYRTLGWDIIDSPLGTIVKIDKVQISDADSIAKCRASKIDRPWVEPPPNVDSPAPQHQCVFTDRIAQILGVRDVGVCRCSDASPYGGPTCEWPATLSKHGKRVCNMFEGVRKTKSKEIAPNGQIVSVNEWGVYMYGSESKKRFGCKVRSDVGSILKARLIPQSVSDFRYVVKSLARPNELEFSIKERAEITALNFNFPVKADVVQGVCNAFSASLPSFTTSDELSSYLASTAGNVTFLDISLRNMSWAQRGESLRINSTTNVTDPCSDPASAVCRALNYNNLAFGMTPGGSFMVDGKTEPGTLYGTHHLAIRPGRESVTVQILGCDIPSAISVSAYNGTYYACSGTEDVRTCDMSGSAAPYDVAVSTTYDVVLSEIGVFWTEDEGRTYIFAP